MIVTITLFEKAMTHPFMTYLEIFRGRKASIFNLYLCRKKNHVVELLLLQILAILHFTWNWEVFKILPFFHRIVSKTWKEDLLVTLTGLYLVLYSFIFFSSISDYISRDTLGKQLGHYSRTVMNSAPPTIIHFVEVN